MVDMDSIEKLLKHNFKINGKCQIDPGTGVVHILGPVATSKQFTRLPVQFGYVEGYFDCTHSQLTTLQGAPREVADSFYCNSNQLTNLIGAPVSAADNFNCSDNPLTSLEGAPEYVGNTFLLSYSSHLPLLRLCMYKNVILKQCPNTVIEILKKHAGTGKAGALKAALELIGAGYRENAKW